MKIGIFLENSSWGNVVPETLTKGMGGRETALVHLALNWAEQGAEVYAFVPLTGELQTTQVGRGIVRWLPFEYVATVAPAVGLDMFVSWENAMILDALRDEDIGVRVIEMQVAHLLVDVEPLSEYVDYIAVLSQWAKEFVQKQHPKFDGDKIVVLPNGIDLDRFLNLTERDDHIFDDGTINFIYSSSPDRGLHHLLRLWPQIKSDTQREFDKRAYLHVAYGIENFVEASRWSHREDSQRALDIEELIDGADVVYHGRIGQGKLAQLQFSCDATLYPADTLSPTETGCISILESMAAGTPVVTTDCDCIGPEFSEVTLQMPLPFNPAAYVTATVDILDPEDYEAWVEAGYEFVAERDWKKIAQQWLDLFGLHDRV